MRRACLAVVAIVTSLAACRAETLVAAGRIAEQTERGLILVIGTEPLAVEDTPETRYWKGGAPAKRGDFERGALVHVRVKTDTDPPTLREIADPESWKWLDGIRRGVAKGTIEKIDAKYLTIKLDDGRTFSYRATDKSQVQLRGRKDAVLSELEKGATVWVKGRLLANLETWAVVVSDAPLPDARPPEEATKAQPKAAPLPTSGTLEGTVLGWLTQLKMFDVLVGAKTLHITYNLQTKFTLEGRPVKADALRRGQACLVTYRRDKEGRIIASKVELFMPNPP